MGARLLALVFLSAVSAGCAYSPCLGDGVIEGDVYLEDGIVTTGGFMINGEQGTTESSAIEGCTGVAGSVRVQGTAAAAWPAGRAPRPFPAPSDDGTLTTRR